MARVTIIALVLCLAALPAAAQARRTAPEPGHKPVEHSVAAREKAKPVNGDPVVARVNGSAIHRSDVLALRATLPPQLQQVPMNKLYPRLIDQIVAMTLVSQTARKERLQDEPQVKTMMAIAEDQILQDAYFDAIMRREITKEKLQARYDEVVKNAPPQIEVHARHILVPTEAEAKDIIAELNKGADFAKLAREKSTDPAGKASGGDVGWFTENQMPPTFAKAAFALKDGQYTKTPVETQFGWHVIETLGRRTAKPPTYQELAPQLARQMAQEIYTARVKELAATAKIEVFNEDGSRPRPPAPPPASAAPAPPAAPVSSGMPSLIPLQNGTPGAPPAMGGPPTLAPGTEELGK